MVAGFSIVIIISRGIITGSSAIPVTIRIGGMAVYIAEIKIVLAKCQRLFLANN